MVDHQAAKKAWYYAVLAVGTLFTIGCAGYGVWVTFFDEQVLVLLIPFAIIAVMGAVAALYGWIVKKPVLAAVGMIAQLFAPIGFAWLLSLIPAACGIALAIITAKQRKNRAL